METEVKSNTRLDNITEALTEEAVQPDAVPRSSETLTYAHQIEQVKQSFMNAVPSISVTSDIEKLSDQNGGSFVIVNDGADGPLDGLSKEFLVDSTSKSQGKINTARRLDGKGIKVHPSFPSENSFTHDSRSKKRVDKNYLMTGSQRVKSKPHRSSLLSPFGPVSAVERPNDQDILQLPTNARKIKSTGDLNDLIQVTIPRPQSKKVTITPMNKDVSATTEAAKLKAALIIQRFYRFYRMRVHFSKIVSNVNTKNMVTDDKSRRRSVMLRILSKDVSKSSEHLAKKNIERLDSVVKSHDSILRENISHQPEVTEKDNNLAKSYGSNESQPQSPPQGHRQNLESILPIELIDHAEEEKTQKRTLSKGVNLFNNDANKGMSFLLKNGCVPNDPLSIAKFMLNETRLSKTKIGEYLGTGEDLQNKVMRSFINELDFTQMDFDQALRHMLSKFRLPGEAQKIDRIMNDFAQKFCKNNPSGFSNADTAYVLAYSLIMLNTDAHNPNVKKKMSLHDFLRNNRGIDNKQDLPEAFMKKLYTNIVNNEIKMNEHDNMFKVNQISSQIGGIPESLISPSRRYIRDFGVQQVSDYNKANTHRHERNVFLFNDLIVITKPKSSGGYATLTLEAGAAVTATLKGESASNAKYQYRYMFNMVTLTLTERPDNQFHSNVLELANVNGRLITLSFITAEERRIFQSMVNDFIDEVADIEEDKLQKLKKMTSTKSKTAKWLIEEAYSADHPKYSAKERVEKYGSLRKARVVLQTQSLILRGKKFKAGGPKDLHPDVQDLEPYLSEFGASIKLCAPSPSPEVVVIHGEVDIDGDSNADKSSIYSERSSNGGPESLQRKDTAPSAPTASNEKLMKRRNTITGYLLDGFHK